MDPIKNLRVYMLHYPGNFIGFFQDASIILNQLGIEWGEFGRKDLEETFKTSSDQVMEVAAKLAIAQGTYTEEQGKIDGQG